ncbi:MAG: agmatinase [Lentisphaerae bacterium]|nr:agmatinase [Lentisphaerota bacterium]
MQFLEYHPRFTGNPDAPYAVLPAPYERTTCFAHGTVEAPAAILRASELVELFDEELKIAPDLAVQTLPVVDCRDGSDADALGRIEKAALAVVRKGRFCMAFGGEHTVTFPLVKAARAAAGPLSVLQIDAHTDLRDSYKGKCLSHACVMRRVKELGVPVTHVGIRSLSREEFELIERERLPVFWARPIVQARDDVWIDTIVATLGQNVYVSVDVDGLDPSYAPGTGTPEPGGLSWYHVTSLLRRVCAERRVVAADIVEVIPSPAMPISEYLAARLAVKLMIYHKFPAVGVPQTLSAHHV